MSERTLINEAANSAVPSFQVDPFWPKPLPNNWIIGQVAGVAVDSHDHVWIIHRPRSLTEREAGAAQNPPISDSCYPAPSVIEFDAAGNLLRAWGGPDDPHRQPWIVNEHGLFIDQDDNLWISSSGADHLVVKFTPDGQRLLTIGEPGITRGSNDPTTLGRPADIAVDPVAGEAYVADGYGNRRIIVFDAKTGAYKRHWGAYGEKPDDSELPPYDPDAAPIRSFRSPMHAVRIGDDGLVYAADRVNNRIQVFRKNGEFVKEAFVAMRTRAMGSIWDFDFSTEGSQEYLYIPDGTNMAVWILRRKDLEIVGRFGRGGRWAGCFEWVHALAADSAGNLFTGEVNTGKRVQKFLKQ